MKMIEVLYLKQKELIKKISSLRKKLKMMRLQEYLVRKVREETQRNTQTLYTDEKKGNNKN